jgi:inhibitor of KinA sporulation pathway (predicted exonuclease)
MSQSKYLVIDLEATCDDGGAVPRHEMEIIEIGAVLVDPGSFQITREFQIFVRPVIHTTLTPFCTKLTSITQDQVDDAPTFPEAIASLREFLEGERKVRFCSWGAYDRNQFRQDARLHGVSLPFDDRLHINLKAEFAETLGARRGLGLGRAIRRVGLTFEGSHHRGIDDARNIARLMPWIYQRVPFPATESTSRPRRRGGAGRRR